MSTHNHPRRIILRGLLATGCALCLPRLSLAQGGKLSKAQAQYQDQPKGDQKCGNCMHLYCAQFLYVGRGKHQLRGLVQALG